MKKRRLVFRPTRRTGALLIALALVLLSLAAIVSVSEPVKTRP